MPTIKAVLFDLFETLITESHVAPTRASSVAHALGLEWQAYTRDGFVRAVEAATQRLVDERFLLQEDADRYVNAARESDLFPSRATGERVR